MACSAMYYQPIVGNIITSQCHTMVGDGNEHSNAVYSMPHIITACNMSACDAIDCRASSIDITAWDAVARHTIIMPCAVPYRFVSCHIISTRIMYVGGVQHHVTYCRTIPRNDNP